MQHWNRSPSTLSFLLTIFLSLGISGCGDTGGSDDNNETPPNTRPVANAGTNQTVTEGDTVSLDGSASSDPDSDTLSYQWTFVSRPAGSSASLSDSTVINPVFTADAAGSYIIELITSDGTDQHSSQLVVGAFEAAQPPLTDAGPNQTVIEGDTVTLDGSASFDPNTADILSYQWSIVSSPAGSAASLNDPSAISPVFTADMAGSYLIELSSSDGLTAVIDQVQITASPLVIASNLAPITVAGSNQIVTERDAVILNGSASSDPNSGDTLSYQWTISSTPTGSAANLSNTNTVSTGFTADIKGIYVIELTVSDGSLQSTDNITVTALELNLPPVADAGPDQSVTQNNTATLDGSASMDANAADTLSYQWSIVSQPAGSNVSLDNATAAISTFSANVLGDYLIELVIDDGSNQHSDQITINVFEVNLAPVAEAGPDQTINRGSTVTLDGSASSDSNISATLNSLSYQWTLTAPTGSSATLSNANTVSPSFIVDVDGSYIIELTSSDGELQATDQVEITGVISTTHTNATATDIPDADITTGTESTVTVTDGPTSIGFVAVYVNITHTSVDDLTITLVSPDGTVVGLSDKNGCQYRLDYKQTVFDDRSTFSIDITKAPFTGVFQPEQPLSAFNGMNANADGGVWTLHVYDYSGTEIGTLDNWSLMLSSASAMNLPPHADAGVGQAVQSADTVILDGSASWDPDATDTLTYNWSLISKPDGSNASFDDATLVNPSFVADVVGDYVIQLITNDGQIDSQVMDEVTVSASSLRLVNTVATIITDADDFTGQSFDASNQVVITDPDGYDLLVTDSTSTVEVSAGPASISRVIVRLDITHAFATDLNIRLESPAGTFIDLSIASGDPDSNGSAIILDSPFDDDYTRTIFNDDGALSITFALQPFTGVFQPEQPLSVLNAENANGTWTLHLSDDAVFDEGTLNSWSLFLD